MVARVIHRQSPFLVAGQVAATTQVAKREDKNAMRLYAKSAPLPLRPRSIILAVATLILLDGCAAERPEVPPPIGSPRSGGTQGRLGVGGTGGSAVDAALPEAGGGAAATDGGADSADAADAGTAEGPGTAAPRTKMCNGHAISCPMGTYVDCRFLSHCLPVGGSCPIPGAPALSKACEAHGEIGPSCVRADEDCATRRVCPDDRTVHACKAGMVYSCGSKKCLPITKECAAAERRLPIGCEAGEVTVCIDPDSDCKTVKSCKDDWGWCRSGETFDCTASQCVPAGKTCTNPLAPQLCPGLAGGPAFCAAKDADCSTAKKCSDGAIVACRKDQVVDCDVPNSCAPKDGKCLGDVNSKYCPGKGGSGPDCWPEDVDCNTVTVCSSKRVAACPAGQHFECGLDTCRGN
jgi:hypothetical protein